MCNQNVHNVFHEKEFLQQVNGMLNAGPTDETRAKILHLIQFWANYFQKDTDIFPTFAKMYHRAQAANIQFPSNAKSQYSHLEK